MQYCTFIVKMCCTNFKLLIMCHLFFKTSFKRNTYTKGAFVELAGNSVLDKFIQ